MAVLNDIYIDEYTRTVVRNLLKKTTFSIEEIADLTEVSVDFVKDVKKKIRNRKK
jgi:DNA-dependent RNA polymerase auxiliary subunit epsilon